MYFTYAGCVNLTGSPVCGNNVTDMGAAYSGCNKLTGRPVIGSNVKYFNTTYADCSNLIGSPICTDNVTNMAFTYRSCTNLTGNPVCGKNVTNMRNTYADCTNITGSPVCGSNVKELEYTYHNCRNLTGAPVCGSSVNSMWGAYHNCSNLTGPAVCGPNVVNMGSTYQNCYNLTGSPVCGANVISFDEAYYNCRNITGQPACGNNVTNMYQTYYNCINLTGYAIAGTNVYTMYQAYHNCLNLSGNGYIYSNGIANAYKSFGNRYDYTNRLNLYVPENSTTLTTFLINNARSIVGYAMTWTNAMSTNKCYYCTSTNIYIYPVANVEQAYKENELCIATYTTSNSDTTPVFNSGYTYTKKITNLNNGTFKIVITANIEGQYPSSISFRNQADLLSVQKLKTDNLITLDYMFAGCTKLTEVNSSNWNLDKVTSAKDIFYKCNNLK